MSTPRFWSISTPVGAAHSNIARTIKAIEKAGVAAVHLEDQVAQNAAATAPTKPLFLLKKWSTA